MPNDYVLPTIGVKGTFQLKAPFDAVIDPNVPYSCQAIRTISEMTAANVDAFKLCYEPVKLTQADYNADQAANMQIVHLASEAGDWIYVPASYIIAFPNSDGTFYHTVALTVILGPMQVDKDFSDLQTKVQELILANLGVVTTSKIVEMSEQAMLSTADTNSVEAARAANISENRSLYAQNKVLQSQFEDLLTKFNALQGYVQKRLAL